VLNELRTKRIYDLLSGGLGIEPTADQRVFLEQFSGYLTDPNRFRIFLLKGYAGTGKTTLMGTLVKSLPKAGVKTVLLAPTGRAARVLSSYTGKGASTIHKKIYARKSKDGNSWFELLPNLSTETLFIIDEASMISNESGLMSSMLQTRNLLEDLLRYIYRGKNCMALFVGDTAQLPPVGMFTSPALEESYLADNYRLDVRSVVLKQVVRQTQESGILHNATILRNKLDEKEIRLPLLETAGFPDIQRITGLELPDELEWAFNKYGADNVIVVTRSNKRANQFNQQIRNRIFWMDNELNGGDVLMVVKNNYFWLDEKTASGFIANGDTMKVQKVKGIREMYGFRFADVEMKFTDYPDEPSLECKVILESLSVEGPSLSGEDHRKLFEAVSADYADEPNRKKRNEKVFANPFYNALQVKFAWSVTCHKAQGGQWPVVFIDQGYMTDEMVDKEFLRWFYTAITRSTEKVYFVNFIDKFFAESA
jgi:exodeoxyribonuclease V